MDAPIGKSTVATKSSGWWMTIGVVGIAAFVLTIGPILSSKLPRSPTEPPPHNNETCTVLANAPISRVGKWDEMAALAKSRGYLTAAALDSACNVSKGDQVLITTHAREPFSAQTVRIVRGSALGCVGDMPSKNLGNCHE